MSATIELNRGSDLHFDGFWPDGPGSLDGLDLTGYTIDAIEAHPALDGHITLTISDAPGGRFTGNINWQDDMPTGPVMTFIIRLQLGATAITTPKITVNVR